MKTHSGKKDKIYLITAKTETTVTDVETGYILAIIPADSQQWVVALSDQFTTDGECIVRPFVVAPH